MNTQKTEQWITLDSVVNDYLIEAELPVQKYNKIWHLAFRGMDEMGLDYFYQVKTVKLPVEANKTVQLPADYRQYTKIGALNTRGETIPLQYNPKMTDYASTRANRLEVNQDSTFNLYDLYNQATPVFFNYYNDGIFTNLYGIPSGLPSAGNFKIDEINAVILLNETFVFEYVMLEYIASPKADQDYYIPVQFREALIAYLAWADVRNLPTTRRGALGDKEQRKQNFYNQRRLAYARYKPVYLEQYYELNLQNQRLTVKA